MATRDAPGVSESWKLQPDLDSAYRTLADTPAGQLEVPERLTIVVTLTRHPGLRTVTMRWQLVGRRYALIHVEAIPPRRKTLDLEALARLRSSGDRQFRRRVAHLTHLVAPDGTRYTATNPLPEPIDALWRTALTYSTALVCGQRPTRAVADENGISDTAAAQRVKRARDAGYLPPTSPGKAS